MTALQGPYWGPFFVGQRTQIAASVARHSLPLRLDYCTCEGRRQAPALKAYIATRKSVTVGNASERKLKSIQPYHRKSGKHGASRSYACTTRHGFHRSSMSLLQPALIAHAPIRDKTFGSSMALMFAVLPVEVMKHFRAASAS